LTKGFGVYHDGSSGTISATLNWWGANSGPYHIITNPLGMGDQVSDWVNYRPWIGIASFIPSQGPVGSIVTIDGAFLATNTVISISFGTHPTITTTQSSINGTFSATFKVSAQLPGTKVITAQDTLGNLATTIFFIIPSNISVSPPSALAGKEITVCGSSFLGNRGITIDFGTHLSISVSISSLFGTFSATFITDTQTPGTKVITAQDTEGNFATTLFILLPPTFLKVVPSYNLIAKDQEFDVDVKLEDVRNLKGAEVHLSFDPNILQVLELNNGTFPPGDNKGILKGTNNTTGHIDYTVILFSGSATGSGVLCSMRFKGKEGGTSTIVFDFDQPGNRKTMLMDKESNFIPFNVEGSKVYVADSLSVLPKDTTIPAGNDQSYSAYAKCGSEDVNVTGSATFTASGGGSFATNTFTAHYIGTYTIQAGFLGTIGATNVYIAPGTPTFLLYVSGNDQTSTCTTILAEPFVVKIEDAYHNPCPNVSASFAVISSPVGADGYSLSSTQTLTNINGTTSSYLTLGDEPPGSYTIRASSGSLSPFDFTAWSSRRFGNIAGTCLINYGTTTGGIQRTASITVTLIETGATTTTNSNSYFIFNNILVGTYSVSFTYPGATPATKTNIAITQTQVNDTTDIGTVTLIMGDPSGDGQINMEDWWFFTISNGSQEGDPNYDPNCDLNGDGQINLIDLMIFAENLGESQPDRGRGMRAKTKTRDRKLSLRFEPSFIDDAKIGEIITLNILVSGARDSLGGEIHLSFNPEVLEVTNITGGNWPTNPPDILKKNWDNKEGKINYFVGTLQPEASDSGILAYVSFRVKAEGESLVKFEFDTEANRRTLFIEKDYVVPEITPDEGKIEVIPLSSILLQSYPNPSSDSCYIPFKLSEDADVLLEVYNILGQKVRTIEAGYKKAGLYITKEKALFYDARNDRGDKLSQGLYFISLKAGKYSGRQRLVIQR